MMRTSVNAPDDLLPHLFAALLLLIKSKDVHLVLGSINEALVSCVDRCTGSVIHATLVIDDLPACPAGSIGQS